MAKARRSAKKTTAWSFTLRPVTGGKRSPRIYSTTGTTLRQQQKPGFSDFPRRGYWG
jgi:hypothetical protein